MNNPGQMTKAINKEVNTHLCFKLFGSAIWWRNDFLTSRKWFSPVFLTFLIIRGIALRYFSKYFWKETFIGKVIATSTACGTLWASDMSWWLHKEYQEMSREICHISSRDYKSFLSNKTTSDAFRLCQRGLTRSKYILLNWKTWEVCSDWRSFFKIFALNFFNCRESTPLWNSSSASLIGFKV